MPAAIVLLVVVVLYRIFFGITQSADFNGLHNFTPIAAVALCGAVYLPRRIAVALPLVALFVSDAVINLVQYHLPMLTLEIVPRYFVLGLISLMGLALRDRARILTLLAASFTGSVLFYVITNTASWLGDAAYARTFAGWSQALTVGLPGYPPTWWFYRHTLMGDLFFTAVFAGLMAWQAKSARAAQPAATSSDFAH